ncbi:MAG: radical SAM protein [Candidatus Omnitrophota bacterium]
MPKPKNIILINPPWVFAHERDIILSQNLGLAYLAAYLTKYGHQVRIIDALAEGLSHKLKVKGRYQTFLQVGLNYQQIVDQILADTDIIGISAPFTNNAKIVKQLAKQIKQAFPDKRIVLGGVYPSLTPEDAFCPEIDYYIIGEGEIPLLELAEDKDPKQIQGLIVKGQEYKINHSAKIIENLDEIPFPARDKLPMEQYLSFCSPRRDRIKTVSIITSRGCPFDCTFCSIHGITGYKWRMRSADNVLKEIKTLIKDYAIEHIEFEDDNLTLNKPRMQDIAKGIIEINQQGKVISWSAPNGVMVDTLDQELLEHLKAANCLFLNLAVESGDPEMLKTMNKKLNLDKVLDIARICKSLGIKTNAFFMLGYPGETEQSFRETLDFVKKLKTAGVADFYATITRAYPGTKLFIDCIKKGFLANIAARENIFLGNVLHQENAIQTNDFNTKQLLQRFSRFEKSTVPGYLRFYHKYYHIFKQIIPNSFIQKVKKLFKK